MHYTVEHLVSGDENIVVYYRRAVEHWKEIWQRPEAKELACLASLLSSEQLWFEHNCGTRWVGQEIMVVSGIGMLYTTREGFGRNARKARMLYDAFQQSYCSIEVKGISRDVAVSYNLLEEVAA
jgi:hypothetical protein